jgi:hypothetical protein
MISATLVLWLLIAEGIVWVGASGVLCGHAIWLWWYRRRSRPVLRQGRFLLSLILEGETLSPTQRDWLHALPVRLQIRLFVDLAPSLSGVHRQRITALAQELGLLARAGTYCHSRLWWRRLRGVRLLTLVGGGEEVVLPLFRDHYAIIRAQAALWAVDHPRPAVITALLDLLGDPNRLCRLTAQDTLLRRGRETAEPLARALPALSEHHLEAALTVAVGLAEPRFLVPALTFCAHASPRLRPLAAALLGALGGTQGVQALLDLLADAVPEVRAAAAHALGKLGHWPAVSHLAPLLRDYAWIVRRAAGLALRALGAPALLYLRHSLSDADPFAADMAQQVLDLPGTVGLETSPWS